MTRLPQLISTIFLLTSSFQPSAQKSEVTQIDTSIYSQQTVTIQGKNHNGFLLPDGFQLLNSKNQVYLKHSGVYFTWKFKDFNKDGYGDKKTLFKTLPIDTVHKIKDDKWGFIKKYWTENYKVFI